MTHDDQLRKTVAGFGVLLTAVTEMVRAGSVDRRSLDAYDEAADQIIGGLRASGIADEDLQSIHKALARLRLAFEEKR